MGVKERKERDFKKREEQIIETSYQLLTKLEPQQMTMELIAKKTEIGCGTIYKHFKSKDEIYAIIMLRRRAKFDDLLSEILKGENCGLSTLIRTYLEFCFNDISDYRVYKNCERFCRKENLTHELQEKVNSQFEEKIRRIEKIIENSIGQSKTGHPAQYYICSAWGMLRGAVDTWIEGKYQTENLDRDAYCEVVEEMLTGNLNG